MITSSNRMQLHYSSTNNQRIFFLWMLVVRLATIGAAFVTTSNTFVLRRSATTRSRLFSRHASPLAATANDSSSSSLEIVLFGVGDLRVHDHEGLINAVSKCCGNSNRKLVLLSVFDSQHLCKIPGATLHTLHTTTMLRSAIQSIEEELCYNLHYAVGDTFACLQNLALHATNSQSSLLFDEINVHVCDLGEADNSMGYSPYHSLLHHVKTANDMASVPKINILPWRCNLRDATWKDVQRNILPDTYTVYKDKYSTAVRNPLPIPPSLLPNNDDVYYFNPKTKTTDGISNILLSSEDLKDLILSDNTSAKTTTTTTSIQQQILDAQCNTGLFGTHWGTIHPTFCTSKDVQSCFKEYKNDDELLKSSWYISRTVPTNERSLEHAALNWMTQQTQQKQQQHQDDTSTKNIIDGEILLRYLSAPLMFGCISIRQLHYYGSAAKAKNGFQPFASSNPLVDAAESKEWHRLFATSCILKDSTKYHYKKETISYKYWRYQGFLCRYAVSSVTPPPSTDGDDSSSKIGLVLLHGFGANGAQWEKMITEISKKLNPVVVAENEQQHQQHNHDNIKSKSSLITFAPDLLGFGHSEKPFLTYTQYLWESYSSAFVNEIVFGKSSMMISNYIIGGNSISGYTAMACAADETTALATTNERAPVVTASGAPGTGRCLGLVLFNTAGRVLTRKDVDQKVGPFLSVAELTSQRKLPKFSPPPSIVASLGGQGLLWYLRPRIQSICVNLYPSNPSAVDDNLCSSILRDSLDPGALAVMISGSKLPPPRTANELLGASFGSSVSDNDTSSSTAVVVEGKWSGPVLIAQGMKDPLNDAVGRANMLQALREGIEIAPLDGGHCPHDELPREAAHAVCDWMARIL